MKTIIEFSNFFRFSNAVANIVANVKVSEFETSDKNFKKLCFCKLYKYKYYRNNLCNRVPLPRRFFKCVWCHELYRLTLHFSDRYLYWYVCLQCGHLKVTLKRVLNKMMNFPRYFRLRRNKNSFEKERDRTKLSMIASKYRWFYSKDSITHKQFIYILHKEWRWKHLIGMSYHIGLFSLYLALSSKQVYYIIATESQLNK